jgi:hypothetical protein
MDVADHGSTVETSLSSGFAICDGGRLAVLCSLSSLLLYLFVIFFFILVLVLSLSQNLLASP